MSRLDKFFHLDDLRNSRVWQEAFQVGYQKGLRKVIKRWLAEGKSVKEIAELLKIQVRQLRQMAWIFPTDLTESTALYADRSIKQE